MTLLLPFLPVYVAQLGVQPAAAVVQWSGIAFSATFFGAALVAPLWGRLADRYGRKPILIRASLGMAVAMSLIGVAQNVWQLVAFRLFAGLVGGYQSGSVVLIATQTPRHRSSWALGILSTGGLAGNLVGPLVGGGLSSVIGVRATFFLAGAVIFVAFLATTLFIREVPRGRGSARRHVRRPWSLIPDRRPVVAMLLTALMLMLAHMSIEPIITVYVAQLVPDPARVVLVSGLVMSAGALGSILAAPWLGRLADRVGARQVVIGCLLATGLLLVPQAFVAHAWQLMALRFLMGMALSGLLPSIAVVIRHNVPDAIVGTIMGYSTSAQFVGLLIGPLLGGFIGGRIGLRSVFFVTSAVIFATAVYNWMSCRSPNKPFA